MAEDVAHRVELQNKLAGDCEDMCKEVKRYPDCSCPNFVKPDETPGVMTWPELLEHMDNLEDWGSEELKGWSKQASALQMNAGHQQQSCATEDEHQRAQLQAKLAGYCEEMCKEVLAYPACDQCTGFVEPDATPGVMTWEELLEHMDNLDDWGHDELKGWKKQAAGF